MDLRQLQALAAIADQRSFSGAAVVLGTVQSNISGRIARLERELNAELVNRSDGRLTEAGEIVLVRARRILREADAVAADVVALGADVRGDVAVGLIGTTGRWLVPPLLADLRASLPLVRVRIIEGTNSSLEPRVAQGELDLAILSHPVASPELDDNELFTEDLMLIVGATHPLARDSHAVTFDELSEMELLLPLAGTAIRHELDDAARRHGVRLRASIELDGVRTLASLVFDGYGPSILPATALSPHLRDRFVARAIEGLPPRRVVLATRRHGFPPTPVRATRQLLFRLVSEAATLPMGVHPVAGAPA